MGVLLITIGIGLGFIKLVRLLTFPYPELVYTDLPFFASVAYYLLSIYLGVKLLRGNLALGCSTFTALAILTVASLLRSVQLDYLVLVPISGSVNPIWLRQFLYAVSMGLAFTAFVSAARETDTDLHSLTRSREYILLRSAVFLYGLCELIVFIDVYVLHFDEFMANAAEYLGTSFYVVKVYLWPLLDAVFALSLIAFAVSMRQIKFQQIGSSRDGRAHDLR